MISAFDISTSALIAQRARLDAIAGNIANASTTRNEAGELEPYKPRFVTFATDETSGSYGAAGVNISSVQISQDPPKMKYQPGHPDAIASGPNKGYVAYPNIDTMAEMVNAMTARRAYEANIGVIEISKNLGQQTLRILG